MKYRLLLTNPVEQEEQHESMDNLTTMKEKLKEVVDAINKSDVNDEPYIPEDYERKKKELLESEAKLMAKDFEKSLAFLDDMVGMEHVKQKLLRLGHYAQWMWVNKEKDFGNARVIRQLAEAVVINHANRIITTTDDDDFTISESDIRQSLTLPQKKTPTRTHIGFV